MRNECISKYGPAIYDNTWDRFWKKFTEVSEIF